MSHLIRPLNYHHNLAGIDTSRRKNHDRYFKTTGTNRWYDSAISTVMKLGMLTESVLAAPSMVRLTV